MKIVSIKLKSIFIDKFNKLSEIGVSEFPVYLISNNKPVRVNIGYPLKESQIKDYLNEINKYHAMDFHIIPSLSFTITNLPDEITFDLLPNEKIFRLVPIIKDIDNPDNINNKFKLGVVTTLVESISNTD